MNTSIAIADLNRSRRLGQSSPPFCGEAPPLERDENTAEMLPPEKQGEAPAAWLPVQLDRGVARVLEFLGSKGAQRVAGQKEQRDGALEGRR